MRAKTLTLKNMKEAYVNMTGDQSSLDQLWGGFYAMACAGFIPWETWEKFSACCHAWQFDSEACAIIDMDPDYCTRTGQPKLVWQYSPYAEYHA